MGDAVFRRPGGLQGRVVPIGAKTARSKTTLHPHRPSRIFSHALSITDILGRMATMNIPLNGDLRGFVEQQVGEHAHASTNECVRALLCRAEAVATLRATIITGAAGPRLPMDNAYFSSLRSLVVDETV